MVPQVGGSKGDGRGASAAELGAALQGRATALAELWRRLHFGGDARRAQETSQLEGTTEALLFELGRQLGADSGDDNQPWQRCRGLLRLRVRAGIRPLLQEFALLTEVALGFAERQGADVLVRNRLRGLLESCAALACAELEHRADPNAPAPQVHFGGVVVELFEPMPRAAQTH